MQLIHEIAISATRAAHDDLVRAARAVPAERLVWRPAGLAMHTVHILAHCAAGNLFLAAAASGGPIPYRTKEERQAAVESCENLTQAEEFLDRSVAAVADAIASTPDARMAELMIMPWGERMPVALGLMAPSYHMQYHAGQINYIQTLLGDDEHH